MERSTYTGPNIGAECGQSVGWFLIPTSGEERIAAIKDGDSIIIYSMPNAQKK